MNSFTTSHGTREKELISQHFYEERTKKYKK